MFIASKCFKVWTVRRLSDLLKRLSKRSTFWIHLGSRNAINYADQKKREGTKPVY